MCEDYFVFFFKLPLLTLIYQLIKLENYFEDFFEDFFKEFFEHLCENFFEKFFGDVLEGF